MELQEATISSTKLIKIKLYFQSNLTRYALLIIAVIYPFYGLTINHYWPWAWDRMEYRLAVSAIFYLCFGLSFLPKLKRHTSFMVNLCNHILTLHLLYITYKNNFNELFAWGMSVSLFMVWPFLIGTRAKLSFTFMVMGCLLLINALVESDMSRFPFLLGNFSALAFLNIGSYMRHKFMLQLQTEIDQREKLQAELEAQKAKSISMARLSSLGEMSGAVAHEINTPLYIISSHCEVLEMQLANERPDRSSLQNSVSTIKNTVNRISQTTQALRNFARDPGTNEQSVIMLRQMLHEIVRLYESRLNTTGIEIALNFIPEKLQLMISPAQFYQAVLNILNNAYDALATSSQPSKWVRIEVQVQESQVNISISNNGPSIPATVQERMMEPFFTTKELGQGSGLGLSTAKGMIEAQQGSLEYVSGRYTTFKIQLPLYLA